MAEFYGNHIPIYTELVNPLLELLKKKNAFQWSKEYEKAFKIAKQAIAKSAILGFPDPQLKFHLFCNASKIGIGAALTQIINGTHVLVCFISRKFQAAEIKYATVEKELLSVVYSVAKFHKCLLDKPFQIYIDNSAVSYLFHKGEPSQRLQRWVLALSEFSFHVNHIAGKTNVVADAMSRFPPDETIDDNDALVEMDALYDHLLLVEDTEYEDHIGEIYPYLKLCIGRIKPANVSDKVKRLACKYKLDQDDAQLCRQVHGRFVRVPKFDEREQFMKETHDGHGHFGINATWAWLYWWYWWPTAYEDVKNYVATCPECQLFANVATVKANNEVNIGRVFERSSVDFVGPFSVSTQGNKYIIAGVEDFTKWPFAKAVKSTAAEVAANFLYQDVFTFTGPFKYTLSDNGSHFDNERVEQFLALVRILHLYTTAYHPQTNGRVEKLNGTLVKAIKKLTMKDLTNWDYHLFAVLYAYRTKLNIGFFQIFIFTQVVQLSVGLFIG